MLSLGNILTTLFAFIFGMCLLGTSVEAFPRYAKWAYSLNTEFRQITLNRRDVTDFDTLIGELKGKGSRMRFGKRSAKHPPTLEDPDLYLADRYMYLL
jgi:hypothetical protein